MGGQGGRLTDDRIAALAILKRGLVSRPITLVMLDHSVTFLFSNLDGPDAELKLETPFDMRKPDGSAARIDPAVKGRDYSAAIDLFECVIVDVAIDDASTLTITFNNGDVLSAPKDGNYES